MEFWKHDDISTPSPKFKLHIITKQLILLVHVKTGPPRQFVDFPKLYMEPAILFGSDSERKRSFDLTIML